MMPLSTISFTVAVIIILFFIYRLIINAHQVSRLKKKLATTEAQLQKETQLQRERSQELTKLRNEVNYNSMHDPVTNLPSRQVFEDRLMQAFNQSKRYRLVFGVLFLNIDGFKNINDALGYDAGDTVLKEISKRFLANIRSVDTVSRFGGSEFAFVLLQLAKAETAAYVAKRLLDVISQPFIVNEQELFLTASIGIAIYPNDGDQAQILLKNADNALNQAKSRGCNTYQFYREEMHALSRRELMLTSRLLSESVYQELSIYYHPQVNVQTKKITCVEAILHWEHPDFGSIALPEFLRLAENNGKIIAIGEWFLLNACQQFQKWKSIKFRPESISVKISSRQLESPHFTYRVSQILQETNLEPNCLMLEIAEGMLLSKLDLVEKSIYMLKHLGVQIAIDNFGTGNLSLQHLKHFPMDCLRIDSSLTQDITINQDSVAIAKMIIALANSLHLKMIAEGVDTLKQKQLLESLGCQIMQGKLFSEPLLAEEFADLASKGIEEKVRGL